MTRPSTLPDFTITKGPPRGRSGGNRNNSQRGGDEWSRGNAPPRRQNSQPSEWSRGQAPPKRNRSRGGGRGNNQNQPPLFDGPVEPLVKSENHWRPKKNSSVMVVAEKKVKSILNKMTKEKFERLAAQMTEVPILSYEMMSMMIKHIFDKAIDEPSFGEIYADLCARLSRTQLSFVQIIESDEEPPAEGEVSEEADEGSHHTVYRWSNDVSTDDAEIMGPFASVDDCYDLALQEGDDEPDPVQRGEMELVLVDVSIRRGIFIKVMQKKEPAEGEENVYYTVYFPVTEAEECGQQLSKIFLSRRECESNAAKVNSFKRSLLNKCETEFRTEDIYAELKKEKAAYEETKASLTEAERAEREEDLDFRRIRIKKQMLGNIKFIGQLYKKRLLKEKIARYCIATLLKLTHVAGSDDKFPEYDDENEAVDLDEEDHEAICSMFTTIGSTIDTPVAANFMNVCFQKIAKLSKDTKHVPTRSRFLYQDLIDLRANKWVPRRKEEKAKTLDEIRREVEKEERKQAMEAATMGGGRGGYNRSSGGGRGGGRQQSVGNARSRSGRQMTPVTDEDGFTTIASGSKPSGGFSTNRTPPKQAQPKPPSVPAKQSFAALADDHTSAPRQVEPLSDEMLKKKIKGMRSDYINDGGSVFELLISMDELKMNENAGRLVVEDNSDRIMDCKDSERVAITKMIAALYTKGKLTSDEVMSGIGDQIEFIDSIALDAPKAPEYLGGFLAPLMAAKAFDAVWLGEQLLKTKADNANTKAPGRIVKALVEDLKSFDASLPKECFPSSSTEAMAAVLGEEWASIEAGL